MYRLNGTIQPSSRSPSEPEFDLLMSVMKELLASLDAARERTESPLVRETLFHIRGFIYITMNELLDHTRPRR